MIQVHCKVRTLAARRSTYRVIAEIANERGLYGSLYSPTDWKNPGTVAVTVCTKSVQYHHTNLHGHFDNAQLFGG